MTLDTALSPTARQRLVVVVSSGWGAARRFQQRYGTDAIHLSSHLGFCLDSFDDAFTNGIKNYVRIKSSKGRCMKLLITADTRDSVDRAQALGKLMAAKGVESHVFTLSQRSKNVEAELESWSFTPVDDEQAPMNKPARDDRAIQHPHSNRAKGGRA